MIKTLSVIKVVVVSFNKYYIQIMFHQTKKCITLTIKSLTINFCWKCDAVSLVCFRYKWTWTKLETTTNRGPNPKL